MRVGSWNIDTNITRLEGGYAKDCFPEWRVNADNSESKENRIDRILEHMGFKVLEHAYNPLGERCFITDGQKLKES
jgi:hypothetical protein